MKKKTRNRIEIAILLAIAIIGFVYVCNQESKLESQLQRLEIVKEQ